MTRVLYVEGNEDGTVGGSHKIQADLVTRLSDRFEPVMLYYQENIWAQRMRDHGLEVHIWEDVRAEELKGLRTGGKLSTAKALAEAIRTRRRFMLEHDIGMVHLNNSPFVGLDDWLPAARLAGRPCVVYAMGDARYEPSAARRALMKRFDRIFPLSLLVQDALTGNGIASERMALAYPGLDVEELAARETRSRDDVRAEFGLGPDQLLVVMVGNVREWKGQHVLVEALGQLDPEERGRLKVLLVGEKGGEYGPYLERLEAMVEQHDLGDVVVLTGRREDVPDLLEAGDIAVHASIRPEPFGLVVLEAMVHGCAVIAADAGGPTEMLTEESGLTFDASQPDALAAHLSRLVADDAARERFAQQARAESRRFDQAEHVAIIEKAYDEILAKGGGA